MKLTPELFLAGAACLAAIGVVLGLLESAAGRLGILGVEKQERHEVKAAEQRWRQHNEEARRAGCRCGKPATEVETDHRNFGSVPVEFWTCDEHRGVQSWRSTGVPGVMEPADFYRAPIGSTVYTHYDAWGRVIHDE